MKTKETKGHMCCFLNIFFQYTQKNTARITSLKIALIFMTILSWKPSLVLIIKIQVAERMLRFIKKQNKYFQIKDFEKKLIRT